MCLKKLLLICVTVLLCSSCAVHQSHLLFEQKSANVADTTHLPSSLSAYRIMPDDVLQIRNLQSTAYLTVGTGATSTNSGPGGGTTGAGESFQVEEDGTVTLPALGHVPIAGLTRHDAARKIEKLYRDSLLRNPIIDLKIMNLKVTLLGEISAQGNIPLLKDRTTLIDVIGQAGGLTKFADEKHVKIIRGGKDNQTVIYADLSDIKTINDPKILLQNNDIIYIARNKRGIREDNYQNISTIIQPSVLILNTALIIYSLLR
ncbi:polysaccharide export outer membrane protein [Mucilaginibacter yixingensis]|uniref:Polysaccharide export outer membrane protein n=1 Tax=Mucilaginibacter yixingensis TaxID=1295612 RepID=A0A2T5JFU0_9SPHI|nr:polysaccharide biosynthesis/export family protein [Mucilaginibacter yixingensis]PTR01292.1 polysaccharide export outer membrane protein [Mucilaginibacter yixingensis]